MKWTNALTCWRIQQAVKKIDRKLDRLEAALMDGDVMAAPRSYLRVGYQATAVLMVGAVLAYGVMLSV